MGEDIEREWEKMEGSVKRTMKEVEEGRGVGKVRKEGWWDEECEKRKGEVKKELRCWRRRGEKE